MGYIEKSFDLKKFCRAIRSNPEEAKSKPGPDALGPEDLCPLLQSAYIQALREGSITIAGLDFSKIGEGDIDILETVLDCSPANRLFDICEAFKEFSPATYTGRAFI